MIHEILLALAGHAGGLVYETEEGFVLGAAAEECLTEAERHLMEQTVQAGFHCKRLGDFAASVRRRHFRAGAARAGPLPARPRVAGQPAGAPECERPPRGGEPLGHYAYGMARQVEEVLDAYRGRVADVEAELMGEPSLPLAHLAAAVEDDRRLLRVLFALVRKAQEQALSAGALLDFLWTSAAGYAGAGAIHDCLWSVTSSVGQVLANQLVAWMVFGRLVDPDGEFFIGRVAGHDVVARSPLLMDDFSAEADAAMAQREWRGAFLLRPEAVPTSILSVETAEKVLFVGKAVRVLLRSDRWLPGTLGAHDAEVKEGGLDPPAIQEEVDALRQCFGAKSPPYVVERSVERVRASAALQLRHLVVEEAGLPAHLVALKGFYLLGHGAFYQTFLEAARGLLQQRPPALAEQALAHGPWAAAMAELEDSVEVLPMAPATPAHQRRAPPLERQAASRVKARFVLGRLDLEGFSDAARQLKLVGMARLVGGVVELGLGQGLGQAQPAMLWLAARQRVARSFRHIVAFQVHPPHAPGAVSPEHGCRLALCLRRRGDLQGALQQAGPAPRAPSPDAAAPAAAPPCSWTALGEGLAVEVALRVLPSAGALEPIAELSAAMLLRLPGGGAGEAPRVRRLAAGTRSVAAPRGAVHTLRLAYDSEARELQVLYGEQEGAICAALVDIGELLSLDLGCAYIGLCLLPLDYRHHVVGDEPSASAPEARYSSRDRPVSVQAWRHHAHAPSGGRRPDEAASGSGACHDAWFACMELSYEAPWPLPLVITHCCLEQYNRLFKLLLAFRHVHLELQHVELPRMELLGCALRAQLAYFVSQVLQYFQQDVIEPAHRRLLEAVAASRDFRVVVAAHEEFLATATTHCFLRSPELHDALIAALRIASLFCRLAPRATAEAAPGRGAQVAGPRAAELQRLRGEFVGTVRSVLRMMSSVHRLGEHSHLAQLLLRLDYNGYFSGDVLE